MSEPSRTAPIQEWRVPGERRPRKVAGRVPWEVHVRVWRAYAALFGHEQSAERIAARGGFGYREAQALLAGISARVKDDLELPDVEGWEPLPEPRT